MDMPAHAFVYNADIDRVVDGDTFDVILDCGLYLRATHRLRLLGVNTPEVRGPERDAGKAATAWTLAWVLRHQGAEEFPFRVETVKADSFGRFLARVWARGDGDELGPALIAAGMAREDVRP